MAKSRAKFVCQECGSDFLQFFGKCPACNTWGSLVEETATASPSRGAWSDALRGEPGQGEPRSAFKLSEIEDREVVRWASGYGELDRVLGGGIVPGSLMLVGGEPGIGRSTLLLQVAHACALQHPVLYVSAEESGRQVKLRAQRLGMGASQKDISQSGAQNSAQNGTSQSGAQNGASQNGASQSGAQNGDREVDREADREANFYLLPGTDLETILRELESLSPHVAIIDSIQTIYFSSLTSAPGSVAQVRECTAALMQVAKRENITLFIVGHVTKEGSIAGPRVLEHLVDTVLFFEGDRFASHRLLRSMKNRFGATHEIGVFEMVAAGLREVPNPSELFLSDREELASGSAIIVACEGTRPIVVEVQALVSPTSYGSARRSATGIDSNRLLQILAVLEKRLGILLSRLDSYVASVGGINVTEPAADLGVAVAVVASFRDKIVDPKTVLIGEVGLGGQVRPVSQLELRLREAAKLGFQRAIVPKGQSPADVGLSLVPVAKVLEAILEAVPGKFDIAEEV